MNGWMGGLSQIPWISDFFVVYYILTNSLKHKTSARFKKSYSLKRLKDPIHL